MRGEDALAAALHEGTSEPGLGRRSVPATDLGHALGPLTQMQKNAGPNQSAGLCHHLSPHLKFRPDSDPESTRGGARPRPGTEDVSIRERTAGKAEQAACMRHSEGSPTRPSCRRHGSGTVWPQDNITGLRCRSEAATAGGCCPLRSLFRFFLGGQGRRWSFNAGRRLVESRSCNSTTAHLFCSCRTQKGTQGSAQVTGRLPGTYCMESRARAALDQTQRKRTRVRKRALVPGIHLGRGDCAERAKCGAFRICLPCIASPMYVAGRPAVNGPPTTPGRRLSISEASREACQRLFLKREKPSKDASRSGV